MGAGGRRKDLSSSGKLRVLRGLGFRVSGLRAQSLGVRV